MGGIQLLPNDSDIEFMRSLEEDFKARTGSRDRSEYKIFYCPVWRAPILVLGINPGGDPTRIAPDGVHYRDGRNNRASSSKGYYENGENDLVDCKWHENAGLLKLLVPILGSSDAIRRGVVKTNLAFVRQKNTKDTKAIERSKDQSTPFLRRILDRVLPDLVLLTGVKLHDFGKRHCAEVIELTQRQVEHSVNQTIIFPARVRLSSGHRCTAVEVAHASQFGWIYEKHSVPLKIQALLDKDSMLASEASYDAYFSNGQNETIQRGETPMGSIHISLARVQGNSAGLEHPGSVGPDDTKRIIRELLPLGLDDDIYKVYLHHENHSIAEMLSYSASKYRAGSRNLTLHQKLEWILRVCREKSVRPGSTDLVRKLAIETTHPHWTPDVIA